MSLSRRDFLSTTSSLALLAGLALLGRRADAAVKPKIGVCDWSIGSRCDPEALEIAKRVGLNGVEVSSGSGKDVCELADPAVRQQYKEKMQKTGMVVCSTAMGFLNSYSLATDPRGPAWLEQTIDITKDLGGKNILLAFFGDGELKKGDVLKAKEINDVVARIRDAVPRAERAGVVLAIENTLSARDNLAILDRIKSDSVRIYYDVGNSTGAGYDVPAEIRLMKDRMCQVHFKDGGHFLGKGDVNMTKVAEALNDINYPGWVILETSTPTKDRDADFKTNADFVKTLFGMV